MSCPCSLNLYRRSFRKKIRKTRRTATIKPNIIINKIKTSSKATNSHAVMNEKKKKTAGKDLTKDTARVIFMFTG